MFGYLVGGVPLAVVTHRGDCQELTGVAVVLPEHCVDLLVIVSLNIPATRRFTDIS